MTQPEDRKRGLGAWQLISSVLAAALGVQSNRNRERDFARGSAKQFVAAGIVATVVFVLVVYTAVRFVLGHVSG